MKTTVVPAQVTTVEDKVAGNLSFTQLLLLISPVFLGGAVFVVFPPVFGFSYLKLFIDLILAAVCMTLAIRIKGKLLLTWIVVIARYNLRPRLYLFDKNDSHLRESAKSTPMAQAEESAEELVTMEELVPVLLPVQQLVRAEEAVSDPSRKFHIKSVKGGLRVVITEAEKEGI